MKRDKYKITGEIQPEKYDHEKYILSDFLKLNV